MKKLIALIIISVWSLTLIAQSDNISGVVNAYTKVVNIDNCPAFIEVSDASDFAVGNKVLIIQMKGAEIDSTSNSPNFGDILNFHESGNYELSRIQSITGNTIQLVVPLTRTYDVNYAVQLVRVSEHINATVSADLTCPAWDGTTGGVLVVDCQNILTLNANITANSTGFRPGVISSNQFDCTPSNDYYYPGTSFFGGRKGEGIADVSNQIINGRGKLANGGGGGNQVNSGGGGGSNFGDGGKGGFGHPVCGVLDMGGLGGQGIPYGGGLDKLFMGGGGGGGQQNDGQATPGTLGGGIIIIVANEIVGNNNAIQSFGIDAISAASDGAGGGGAGGTIAISCNTYTGNVQLDVHGGKGGNANVDHGTAGGGGGGLIYASSALPANVTTNLVGGNPGVWNGTTNSYGSQAGAAGGVLTSFVLNNPVQNSQPKAVIVEHTCFLDQTNIYLNDTASLTQLNWLIVESANPANIILNSNWNGNVVQLSNSGEYVVVAELVYSCYRDTLYDTLNITTVNPIDLGNDTTYCLDGSGVLTLDAGPGYDFYFWQGVDTTQTYTADTTGQYIIKVANIGDNMVINGDFESGNTNFNSEYEHVGCGTLPLLGNAINIDTYTVGGTASCYGIAGTGNAYHAYDVQTANYGKVFWGQTMNVTPNTDYIIRVDAYEDLAGTAYQPGLTRFEIFANNSLVQIDSVGGSGAWQTHTYTWNSGTSNNVLLEIRNGLNNITVGQAGLDPFFDNIFFAPLCTATDTINVTVGELPHAAFSLVDSCEYLAVNYTDLSTITAPESIATWSWDVDNDGVEDYNTPTPSHTFPAGTYTTSLTVTSAIGCSKDTTMPVVIYEQPQGNFTFNNECLYDSVGFVDNSTITAPDMIVGHGWNFGESPTPLVQSTASSPYYTYSTIGSYNVVEVVGSLNGCYDTVVNQVTIYPVLNVAYTVSDTCDNIPLDFIDHTISTTPISSWEWDFGDLTTGNSQNETHTYLASGNYNTELIVVDDNGCTDTASLALTINPTPQVTFNFMNGCLYDTISFIDASIVNAPDNIVSWSWDVDGDNAEDYSTQNVEHLYGIAGDYNVTLTVESNNSCSNSFTQLISAYAVPQASFSASTACVNGGPTQFVNTSSISNGIITTYGWDFGNGNFSLQEHPTNDYFIAASYPVTLGVLSDNGCVDSVTFSIEVLGKPSAAFTQDTTAGCAPLCVAFADTSYDDVPITNWSWKFENNYGESFDQNPTYCYTVTGDYNVGLIITNSQGCKDTIEQLGLISILPLPTADFSLSPTSTDVQNSTIEFTNNSLDAAAWSWNFGDGSEPDVSNYNPSYAYGDTGYYEVELIVYNSYLCSDTIIQYVEILPVDDLFVPSAFSPNGDGKNDVLYARGYIGAMYFAIFDRLGKKVFESEDKEIGWDGMINGKKALEGVYTWYIQAEVNGNAYKLKGDVTLVR
ncbi:MAG: PKD domain-containing protein [Flavobacteriales bacterium]|jgi:gliding motility-associated-like protein|nr:PKD domain-containing protein [Flavobacteriales bacterium]